MFLFLKGSSDASSKGGYLSIQADQRSMSTQLAMLWRQSATAGEIKHGWEIPEQKLGKIIYEYQLNIYIIYIYINMGIFPLRALISGVFCQNQLGVVANQMSCKNMQASPTNSYNSLYIKGTSYLKVFKRLK